MRRSVILAMLPPLALLAACGSEKQAGTQVQMRDMEVVDGTTSDGMTDLDAARADGTAMMPSANGSISAQQPAPAAIANSAAGPSEVVADQ